MSPTYDAIVIGARCAGAPTAMLLARRGYRVLLLDRDRFPSDTISTHMIHPPGVAQLRAWRLLDRLTATGCPPITTYTFDFGDFTIAGRPQPAPDGSALAYAPRRTILDQLLVDAAVEAGADFRETFTVEQLLLDEGRVTGIRGHSRGGAPVEERARVVIGADGRHSLVARTMQPAHYHDRPTLQCGYYTYWSNLPVESFAIYARDRRGWGAFPTHDGLTLLVVGWPYAEFEANRKDPEKAYLDSLAQAPEFAARVREARREEPYRGGMVSNYFRTPFGPGWALVGDAGYNKDPITAFGISDAFRDAERVAGALHDWLSGARPFNEAMSAYQQARDAESLPMYELTCNLATLDAPPPEFQALLAAVARQPAAQDQFASLMAGTLPVPAFFSPDNVNRIFASAGAAGAA